MISEKELRERIDIAFGVDTEADDDERQLFIDTVSECGWDAVFDASFRYLCANRKTAAEVKNFAVLFWRYYRYVDYPIREPYKFLGYFYSKIDMKNCSFSATAIMDSLTGDVLVKAGYPEKHPVENCDYIPEKDPEIIAEAEKYKAAGE
ncbi:MAG: hypothetical protein J6X53_08310 [Abditibacteriota bacterium]|nr:hypothetical protein [Abditibacteriota bacterium]